MSTVTLSGQELVEQLEELKQEAAKAAEEQRQANEKVEEIRRKLADFAHGSANGSTVKSATPKPRGPVPKRQATAKATPKAKPAQRQQRAKNEVSLKATIWDVLDRDAKEYKKYFPDYPADGVGLKISEIKAIVEKEGKWTSNSDNIAPQIQVAISNLKADGKLAKDAETKRNFIVQGAELDGPELDEKGHPVKQS